MKNRLGVLVVAMSLLCFGISTVEAGQSPKPSTEPTLKDVGPPAVAVSQPLCILTVSPVSLAPLPGGPLSTFSGVGRIDLIALCPPPNSILEGYTKPAPATNVLSGDQIRELLLNNIAATQHAVAAGLARQDQIDDAVARVRTAALADLRTELVRAYTAEVKAYQDRLQKLEEQLAGLLNR